MFELKKLNYKNIQNQENHENELDLIKEILPNILELDQFKRWNVNDIYNYLSKYK